MRYVMIIVAALLGVLVFLYDRRCQYVLKTGARFTVLAEDIIYIYGEYLKSKKEIVEETVSRVPVTIAGNKILFTYDPDDMDNTFSQFLLFLSMIYDAYDVVESNYRFLRSDDYQKIEDLKVHVDDINHDVKYNMWLSGYKIVEKVI